MLLPFQRFFVGTQGPAVQSQLNIVNNLTIVAGAHQWKAGVDYRRLSLFFGIGYIQFIQFATANDVRVSPTSYSITGVDPVGVRFHNLSAYAQDTWRAARRLTLTYGLRGELNPPPEGTDGKDLYTFLGIDDPSTLRLAPAGTPLYETTWTNIAPRVGAAYVLADDQGLETVR